MPFRESRRARLRLLFGIATLAVGFWALALYAGYGQSLTIGPWRLSSRNYTGPLWLCAAGAIGYASVSGAAGLRRDAARLKAIAHAATHAVISGYTSGEARADARILALVIAIASIGVALAYRESTAGGSDSFSYVTQADLWFSGAPRLRIEMPIAAAAPWPNAIATLTPFGYRSTDDRRGVVPVTAPGLPLLMALFKVAGGHCAMFWVVPLTGGLLVWATFLLGRQIVSDAVGLASAWLVATSPTFLSMSKSVMSDVPAASFWALATALILRGTPGAALCAGLSASAAVLVRTNLLPLTFVLGGWLLVHSRKVDPDRRAARAIAYAVGALPGCVAVFGLNRWVYGSSVSSGYGDVGSLFSWSHVPTNIGHFALWLSDTQTPLALVGAIALVIPTLHIWATARAVSAARLLALVMLLVLVMYAAYTPFQDWWYLRFLLPAWPAIFVGTSALVMAFTKGRDAWARALAVLILAGLGLRGVADARRLGVYPPGEGERRYATIAALVARVTDPSSVIVTTSHVGTLRYYGGRLTVRYDNLDPAWLDRALAWFEGQGRHPYILLEEEEVTEFRTRFGGGSRTGMLELDPMLTYEAHQIAGRVYLFDPRTSADPRTPAPTIWEPEPIQDPQPRCPVPAEAAPR